MLPNRLFTIKRISSGPGGPRGSRVPGGPVQGTVGICLLRLRTFNIVKYHKSQETDAKTLSLPNPGTQRDPGGIPEGF